MTTELENHTFWLSYAPPGSPFAYVIESNPFKTEVTKTIFGWKRYRDYTDWWHIEGIQPWLLNSLNEAYHSQPSVPNSASNAQLFWETNLLWKEPTIEQAIHTLEKENLRCSILDCRNHSIGYRHNDGHRYLTPYEVQKIEAVQKPVDNSIFAAEWPLRFWISNFNCHFDTSPYFPNLPSVDLRVSTQVHQRPKRSSNSQKERTKKRKRETEKKQDSDSVSFLKYKSGSVVLA